MSESDLSAAQRPFAQVFSGLSDDEIEMLSQADHFAKAELYPLAQLMDDEEWWPGRGVREDRRQRLFRHHRAGSAWRRRPGSVHQRHRPAGLRALEPRAGTELGGALEPLPAQRAVQRRRAAEGPLVPDMCSDQLIGALGLTEPGAGSDALGSMREIAESAVLLASPAASFMTGEAMTVDGGGRLWGKLWKAGRPDDFRTDNACQ